MDDHRLTSEQELLLERVLLGEIAADAPRVQSLLADSPAFRDALARLRPVFTSLDEFNADAASALTEVDDADRRWAAEALATIAAPPPPTRLPTSREPVPTRRSRAWPAAAALLVGFAATWSLWPDAGDPTPPPPQHLGSGIDWVTPEAGAELRPGMTLEWRCGPPTPAGGFRVELFDANGEVVDSVWTIDERLTVPADRLRLPTAAAGTLRVSALDATGVVVHRSGMVGVRGG